MARWAAGAKWAEGPAPDDQRDTPLVLSLSEGLGRTGHSSAVCSWQCAERKRGYSWATANLTNSTVRCSSPGELKRISIQGDDAARVG